MDINNALNCLCGAIAFVIASSHVSNKNFCVDVVFVITLWV